MKGAMIVLVLLSPVAVKGQDTGLAGCFAVWEINSDAPNGRALLTPYLEFVDARAVELVTEDGVVRHLLLRRSLFYAPMIRSGSWRIGSWMTSQCTWSSR